MGRTHAASGAATWLVGCAIAAGAGVDIGVHHVVVGAAMTAYGAVLPDIDMPRSNVALSLGWPTRIVATRVARFGAWLHAYTRLPKDRRDEDGHRCFTHTIAFCLITTLVLGAVGLEAGPVVAAVFITVAVATGARSILKPADRRFKVRVKKLSGRGRHSIWLSTPVTTGLAAAAVMWFWPAPSGWWLGLSVGLGCLLHNLGDAMTNTGVPLFFPWEIGGKRWHCVRVPEPFRFETRQESRTEHWIYLLCKTSGALAMGFVLYLAWPDAVAAVTGWVSTFVDTFQTAATASEG